MKQHSLPLDARKTSALWNELQNIAKYCKYMQIYANMFESLRLLQIGWLHGHRKHQKTLPSAGQRPLQLPARVRSTQKPSPKRFSTRATAAAAQIWEGTWRNPSILSYMFKAYNGLRRPLANTKWLCIDTWSNSSCQVAAFLKTHGWHTFFLHRNWFTDWRLLAPENTDHLISFDHFGMKSKLLLLAYV